MRDYTFDVKMFATVHVLADTEEQARKRLAAFQCVNAVGTYEGVEVSEISVDDEYPELVSEE